MRDRMRTWTDPDGHGFRLEMYDSGRSRGGKWEVDYEFFHSGDLIFTGTLGCSPLHAIDSDETVQGILCFCSLRPGDTDAAYFSDYTPAQLAWASRWGEALSVYSCAG